MSGFQSMIVHHADRLNELQERVHATFKERDRSESHTRAWKDACLEFHRLRTEVDKYTDGVTAEAMLRDKRIRQFVFDFLSVDPIYFRSGYEKERLLRALKSLELSEREKAVIRETILRRVRDGALREFRRFCQLVPRIQNDDFVSELRKRARSTDPQIRRRAAFALEYVAE
jgi:hypothetical protein